jgi:hypothetical protein
METNSLLSEPMRLLSGTTKAAVAANGHKVEMDACGNPAKHEEHHAIPLESQVLFGIIVGVIIG